MEQILTFFDTDFETLVESFVAYTPSLIAALLVFVLFWFVYLFTKNPLQKVLRKAHFDEILIRILVNNIYRSVVFIFGIVMALNQLGIDVVAALAGFGIVGIAIGFAAKDSLSNIIAGFMIFWDKPFRVNQWITVAGQYGKVNDITLRTTRIRTRNNTYVVIPNQKIIDEVLINHSRKGITRLDAEIGIAYKENIDEARKVLLEAMSSIDGLVHDPEPKVVVDSLGDSSVNLIVQGWIQDAEDETGVLYEMIEASKKSLDKAGIEIPFPHMQLFVEDIKEKAAQQLRDIKS